MECADCLLYSYESDVNYHFCKKMDELSERCWEALCKPTWDFDEDIPCPYFEEDC